MPKNFYEILNIQPASSRSEIEHSLDAQYNKLRQLVTHHDPNVVNQANLGLQILEKMRSVLTDDGKRAAYDAAINSNSGNFEDVTSNPQMANSFSAFPVQGSVPHSPPRYLPPTQASGQRIWTCPKCQSPNAVNSQYCKKCGESLSRPCSECNSLVEKSSKFCTNCGVNIVKAQYKKDLEKELARYKSELSVTQMNVPILDKNLPALRKSVVVNGGWTVVAIVAGLTYLLSGVPGQLPGVNLTGLVMALAGDLNYLSAGITDIALVGGTLAILISVVIFLSIMNRISPTTGIGAAFTVLLFISIPKTTQSSLMMAGGNASSSTFAALIATAIMYFLTFKKIFAVISQNFERLKPYHKKIPNFGCLGIVFAAILLAIPALYGFYSIMLSFSAEEELINILSNYELYVWYVNALQLFILGLVLFGYMVMGWRTSQNIDVKYHQTVLDRSEKMEKLKRQILSLSQEVAGLDLRS